MKTALSYAGSLGWFILLCMAAYFGWAQDMAGVRNLVYLLLAVTFSVQGAMACVWLAYVVMYEKGQTPKRPGRMESHLSIRWTVGRAFILSCVFAWFGSLFVAFAIPVLVATGNLIRVVWNESIAKDQGEKATS